MLDTMTEPEMPMLSIVHLQNAYVGLKAIVSVLEATDKIRQLTDTEIYCLDFIGNNIHYLEQAFPFLKEKEIL